MGSTPDEILAGRVGELGLTRADGPIHLAESDPAWPGLYEREADRIRAILGDRAIRLEHVGSTSIPGLAAKPIIDIVLVVTDSADEAAYLRPLVADGYVLRIREPEWFEHRLLNGPDTKVNLHVFSDGCPEIERMVAFRDYVRAHDEERQQYEGAKRELAAQHWVYVQDYADAKSEVVEAIIARASAAVDGTVG